MRQIVRVEDKDYVILKRMRGKLLIAELHDQIVHRCRMQAGLTQGRMAKAMGISQSALSRLESGQIATSSDLAERALHILAESVKGDMQPNNPDNQERKPNA